MKVLVIEDDPETVQSIAFCFQLRWPEANLVSASRGEKGLELAETESPDVIILDIGLPDMGGLDVLRQLRGFCDAPIIILTGWGEEMDKVKGLEMGADDYIVKPFHPGEFLARVKAVLRRSSQMPKSKIGEKPFITSRLKMDFATQEVSIAGEPVKLTRGEYDLLYQLVGNEGKVLPAQTLLERVWGPEYAGKTEYVITYIASLRKRLEEKPDNPKMILGEPGIGYKFVGR